MANSKSQITEISGFANELTDADLVFEVTAAPGSSDRHDSIRISAVETAVEATLRAFAASVETHVEKVAVLEEVSKSCTTAWFRFHAHSRPQPGDSVMPPADPALLKYVAQALLTVLSWIDGRRELRLSDLQQALRVLAWGTSATSSTRPALPSSVDLLKAVDAWRKAKEVLQGSAYARLTLQQGSVDLDLERPIPELASLVENKVVNRTVEMILLVERPDYSGSGEWLFKHGQAHFLVRCEHCDLLDRFYRRDLDIRPGDALRCKVEFDTAYGPDHEVVGEKLSVVEVLEVLSPLSAPIQKAAQTRARSDERTSRDEVKERMLIL